jgi:hypothetical protein
MDRQYIDIYNVNKSFDISSVNNQAIPMASKRGRKEDRFAILGYINSKEVSRGTALGRKEAEEVAIMAQRANNSVTAGIYNTRTGELVSVRKPKVCRSGKNF